MCQGLLIPSPVLRDLSPRVIGQEPKYKASPLQDKILAIN